MTPLGWLGHKISTQTNSVWCPTLENGPYVNSEDSNEQAHPCIWTFLIRWRILQQITVDVYYIYYSVHGFCKRARKGLISLHDCAGWLGPALSAKCISAHLCVVHLFVLGFKDKTTLVGHFVLSPREREKRDRRDSRGDEREEQGRKENKWKWKGKR